MRVSKRWERCVAQRDARARGQAQPPASVCVVLAHMRLARGQAACVRLQGAWLCCRAAARLWLMRAARLRLLAEMTRCVGNGNHQCRGSGIKQTNSLNGTTNQKAKAKKAIAKRKGWGGQGCLKSVGKSLNK